MRGRARHRLKPFCSPGRRQDGGEGGGKPPVVVVLLRRGTVHPAIAMALGVQRGRKRTKRRAALFTAVSSCEPWYVVSLVDRSCGAGRRERGEKIVAHLLGDDTAKRPRRRLMMMLPRIVRDHRHCCCCCCCCRSSLLLSVLMMTMVMTQSVSDRYGRRQRSVATGGVRVA